MYREHMKSIELKYVEEADLTKINNMNHKARSQ